MVLLNMYKYMVLKLLIFLLCRLFHEERPVSHTIHCNALPKEEPKERADADSSQGGKITMVTDVEYRPAFTSEEYAT